VRLSPVVLDFVKSLNTSDWSELKDLFLHHYRDPNFTSNRILALNVLAMNKNESVQAFSDRFLKVLRRTNLPADSMMGLYEYKLPSITQQFLRTVKLQTPITSLQELIRISTAISPADELSSKQSKPRTKKECDLHGQCGHTTAECKGIVTDKTPKAIPSVTSPVTTKRIDSTAKTCYKCKQPWSHGHECADVEVLFAEMSGFNPYAGLEDLSSQSEHAPDFDTMSLK
jgi:hypothetical protein